MPSQSEVALPTEVSEGLDRFCAQLRDALADRLVSIVLYGGLAKGEYAPPSSNVNVMVVLKDATVETLDKLVSPVQQGIRDFRLAVMVLSEADLRRSAAVFPTKYLDIQQHHRVLWGKAVLTDLAVARDHLRLRCEQEIKNLLIRLRQFYVQRAHYPELIESTLTRAISSFLASLRVLLILRAGQAPTGKAEIANVAAREFGLDAARLRDVLALKAGEYKPDGDDLRRLYDAFMLMVQRAADAVDAS